MVLASAEIMLYLVWKAWSAGAIFWVTAPVELAVAWLRDPLPVFREKPDWGVIWDHLEERKRFWWLGEAGSSGRVAAGFPGAKGRSGVPTSTILALRSALHGWRMAEVGSELCCDQFDGFGGCFEGYHVCVDCIVCGLYYV